MKKILFILTFLLTTQFCFSQWEKVKFSFLNFESQDDTESPYLFMTYNEEYGDVIVGLFNIPSLCDKVPTVDMIFTVGGTTQVVNTFSYGKDDFIIITESDLLKDEKLLSLFKRSSKLIIKVSDTCWQDVFSFDMTGSSVAITKMSEYSHFMKNF